MSPTGFVLGSSRVWDIYFNGSINRDHVATTTNGKYNVSLRPVLILKSDTQISLGDGTKNNPYVLS